MRNDDRAATLRIGGSDLQIVQFMDYPDFNDPQGLRHVQLVSFARARLSDVNDQEIFVGQIIVRINAALTPTSLAILTRLLQPFGGYFVMIVSGTYTVQGTACAEVVADAVPWTNIQPSPAGREKSYHLVPAEAEKR